MSTQRKWGKGARQRARIIAQSREIQQFIDTTPNKAAWPLIQRAIMLRDIRRQVQQVQKEI